jgi:hypothetical protein
MSTSRTVIVCLPAGTPIDWFSASEILDWHQQPTGTPQVFYPVRRRRIIGWLTGWSARHLVQPVRRFGVVIRAAGGRRARLDLTAAAAAANSRAITRWRTWAQVVRSTPVARPWPEFLAQHRADPDKLSREEAVRRFEAQPRVLAMLSYTGHPVARHQLDPYELDAYQAGEATYAAVHWQHAIAADALITDDGRLLEPASESLADRLRYLTDASAHIRTLRARHQLLAVKVAT